MIYIRRRITDADFIDVSLTDAMIEFGNLEYFGSEHTLKEWGWFDAYERALELMPVGPPTSPRVPNRSKPRTLRAN